MPWLSRGGLAVLPAATGQAGKREAEVTAEIQKRDLPAVSGDANCRMFFFPLMLSLWALLAGALSSIPLHCRPAPSELRLFQGWAGAAAPGSRAGRCGGMSSCCREAPAPSRADTFLGFFWGLLGTSALLQLGDCDGATSVTPLVGRSPRAPQPSLIASRDGQPPACEPGQPCCGVQRARLGLPAVLPVKGAEICRKAARAAWMQANQGLGGLGGPRLCRNKEIPGLVQSQGS